jgi:hypothetical protein
MPQKGSPAKIIFRCEKCGAAYQAAQQWIGVRASGSFKCHVCKEILYSWAGDYDYINWEAFEP